MARPSIVGSEVRAAVSDELKRYLKSTSISKLARELNVSRQSLHDYRDGLRTPSGEQLAKLLALPGFSLKIGGKIQRLENFPTRSRPVSQPHQEEFPFETPITLESETRDLRIGVKGTRRGVLELTVRIQLAK